MDVQWDSPEGPHYHGEDVRCVVCAACDHSQKSDCLVCGHIEIIEVDVES